MACHSKQPVRERVPSADLYHLQELVVVFDERERKKMKIRQDKTRRIQCTVLSCVFNMDTLNVSAAQRPEERTRVTHSLCEK